MKPNFSPTSRRVALTQLGAAGALVGLASLGRAAEPEPASTSIMSCGLNVRDCGAVGDGSTDDTAAFSQALDTVGKAGGGIVFVPTGNYRIQGHLSVPDSACDFTGFDRNHVLLGAKSKSTLITGTRFLRGLKLKNEGGGKVETGLNIDE